jgi:hypothetical protein
MEALDCGAFGGPEHSRFRSHLKHLRKVGGQGWRVNFWQAVCDHLVHAYPGEALSWNQACPIIADLIEADLKQGDGLTEPLGVSQLGAIFGYHRNSVRKLVLARYHHEAVGKRYRLRVADMPAEYRQKHGL